MQNATNVPVKVRFDHKDNKEFRGVINRHNRRRYLKLSRLGRLTSNMVPWAFLYATEQGPFAPKVL